MKWYYKVEGSHVRVRVFLNGANCGELCFRVDGFSALQAIHQDTITFIAELEEQ